MSQIDTVASCSHLCEHLSYMINSFLKSLLAILVISSCAHEKTTSSEAIPETRPRDELSLKSDRSALDEERKQIPIETKRSNDEMALVLQLMQTNELGEMQEPSKIRDRFDKAVRERRTKLDRELQKKRDEFSHNEKTTRDLVFAEFKKAREDFAKEKHESGERSQFFSNQD